MKGSLRRRRICCCGLEREEERENVRESFNMIVAAPIPESVCNRERERCVVTRMMFK